MRIEEHTELASHSTFRMGGAARYSVVCATEDDVADALAWAREHDVCWRALGSGSNTLVSEHGFDGLVIWFSGNSISIDAHTGRVIAQAGALTATVATQCARAGLSGFEWAVGVPGTIGGAVCGNAGAMGGEMTDVIQEVRVMDHAGTIHIISHDACTFRYRHSRFKDEPCIILSATLQLQHAAVPEEPLARVREVLQYRMATQPKGSATCGCTFKNYECNETEIPALRASGVPEEFLARHRVPAGWLIEHAGLKGARVGGASVSTVHANFIVNDAHATSADVMALMAHIKAHVASVCGVQLTEELVVLQ